MRLRRTAVMAAAAVAAIIIAVIAGMRFMGLFGREGPARETTPRPAPRPMSRRPSSATNGTADRRPSSIKQSREHGWAVVRRRNRRERLHDSALQPGPRGKRPRRTRGRHGLFLRGRRDGCHTEGTLGGVHPPESRDRTEPEEAHLGGATRRSDLRFGMARGIDPAETLVVERQPNQ